MNVSSKGFVPPATCFRGSQNLECQIPTFQLTSYKCMAPSQKQMKLSDCFCLLLSISYCSRKWLWTNTSTAGNAPISTISLETGNILAKSRGSTARWQWESLSQQKNHLISRTFLKLLSLYFLICCRGLQPFFGPWKTIFPRIQGSGFRDDSSALHLLCTLFLLLLHHHLRLSAIRSQSLGTTDLQCFLYFIHIYLYLYIYISVCTFLLTSRIYWLHLQRR